MDEQLPHFGHGQIWLQLLIHGLFLIRFYHCISKFMTCTSGCNYSLCTPDDGCGRHLKHVEWLGSKTRLLRTAVRWSSKYIYPTVSTQRFIHRQTLAQARQSLPLWTLSLFLFILWLLYFCFLTL